MAKSKLLRPGNLILLAGLIGLGFGVLGWKQQFAKAQNAEVATGVNWSGASFPVEGFQEYTSPFGYRSSGFHYGLDLAAPQGSYIRSWWQGTVTEVWHCDSVGSVGTYLLSYSR
jgi:murein DD-endopeptidase MepM/ murein hydrolase activator NlpD